MMSAQLPLIDWDSDPPLPCFRADSPANPTLLRALAERLVMSVISGVSAYGLYQSCGPGGSWARTWQDSSLLSEDGFSDESSMIWPAWGTAWDGRLTALDTSGLDIAGCGYFWLPTPTTSDARGCLSLNENPNRGALNLITVLYLMALAGFRLPQSDLVWRWGNRLVPSPIVLESMMGFPPRWTELEPSETP